MKKSIWYKLGRKQKLVEYSYQRCMAIRKRLDPHRIPEKQSQPIVRLDEDRKPRIGQGRAGVRRKAPPLLDSRQGISVSKPIVISNEIDSKKPKPI